MKKRSHAKTAVFITAAAVLLGVLGFSLYMIFSDVVPRQRERQRYEQLREMVVSSETQTTASESPEAFPDTESGAAKTNGSHETRQEVFYDYSPLHSMNSDMVGWLRVPDTEIDYPVMKSAEEDPEYYLHRDFDRNYSLSGSLFISGGCDENSDVFIIYGHNMNDGSMFGRLDYYQDADYSASHSEIFFDAGEEQRVYRVFAAFQSEDYDKNNTDGFRYYDSVGDFTKERYAGIVSSIQIESVIDTGYSPQFPAQIMMLSTCSYHTDNGRFVVAAYRIK